MSRYTVTLYVLHAIGSPREHWRYAQCDFSNANAAADYAAALVTTLDDRNAPESPHWYRLTNGRTRASFENAARTLRVEVVGERQGVPGEASNPHHAL